MSKCIYYFLLSIFLFVPTIFAQAWQQTAGTPQGSGVTDMLVRNNGWIYVTTGSYNWPSVPGGIRVSTDDGTTWQNQTNSYVARTIIDAPDGNLYASVWPDPVIFPAEGLYRSTNNGALWSPLGFVQAGDNIFSIAVIPTNPVITIFAGTRNGVIRSTDNGVTFQNTSSGIPTNSWVRDLEADSSGIIAAATTNGVFISTDNGDAWQMASGIEPGDTVVKLLFSYDISSDASGSYLMPGSEQGNLYISDSFSNYLLLAIAYSFGALGSEEISGDIEARLRLNNWRINGITTYPTNGSDIVGSESGFFYSYDRINWTQDNSGLPTNPKLSALAVIADTSKFVFYTGTFEDTTGGAKIYKRDLVVDVKEYSSNIPAEYFLFQNYPNPFNPSTTIQFSIPEQSFVKLEVFNALGEKVSTLVSEEMNAGSYKYDWSAENLPSGIYLYRLVTNNFSQMKKMILIK